MQTICRIKSRHNLSVKQTLDILELAKILSTNSDLGVEGILLNMERIFQCSPSPMKQEFPQVEMPKKDYPVYWRVPMMKEDWFTSLKIT